MTTTPSKTVASRNVPFFKYPELFKSRRDQLLAIFEDVGSRGAYIMQKDLVAFEQNLAKACECKHAIGVANGTDAIVIALRAGGIGPGDEVLFCSHTYVATAAAIHFVGATPVPVECGSDHMMDVTRLEEAITPRTRAILPTQLNGRTCDMDAIKDLCAKYDLKLFEDAAQALGSKFRGQCAGTFGKAGTISFYPAKTLGCLGDGGAILTNDDTMYREMIKLRDHGRDETGEFVCWGYNSRLDNLQAAILDAKLTTYDEDIARRRAIAAMYHQRLSDVPGIVLPPPPVEGGDHFDIYQNYEVEVPRRDDLKSYLKDHGVGTLIQWGGKAVHQFTGLGLKASLPFTERMIAQSLLLPISPAHTDDDIEHVCAVVRTFYAVGTSSRSISKAA